MEIDQKLRPRAPPKHKVEEETRKKCNFCCAAYCSGFVFTVVAGFTWLPTYLTAPPAKNGVTWLHLVDRFGFTTLPITAVCFVHQWMMCQALWSPRKKPIYDLNWTTAGMSVGLQLAAVAACTAVSRFVLPKLNRTWRLNLWEYNRIRRGHTVKFLPSVHGTLSENFDWVHAMWAIIVYHMGWMMACAGTDTLQHAKYAVWYRGMNYSYYCSPRWREWRETEFKKKTDTVWKPAAVSRWGSIFTLDEWKQTWR